MYLEEKRLEGLTKQDHFFRMVLEFNNNNNNDNNCSYCIAISFYKYHEGSA